VGKPLEKIDVRAGPIEKMIRIRNEDEERRGSCGGSLADIV
jgi:hypothetical protein